MEQDRSPPGTADLEPLAPGDFRDHRTDVLPDNLWQDNRPILYLPASRIQGWRGKALWAQIGHTTTGLNAQQFWPYQEITAVSKLLHNDSNRNFSNHHRFETFVSESAPYLMARCPCLVSLVSRHSTDSSSQPYPSETARHYCKLPAMLNG